MSQRQPRRTPTKNEKHAIWEEGAKAGGVVWGRDEELGTSPSMGGGWARGWL